jgi:hypothetical protein
MTRLQIETLREQLRKEIRYAEERARSTVTIPLALLYDLREFVTLVIDERTAQKEKAAS